MLRILYLNQVMMQNWLAYRKPEIFMAVLIWRCLNRKIEIHYNFVRTTYTHLLFNNGFIKLKHVKFKKF